MFAFPVPSDRVSGFLAEVASFRLKSSLLRSRIQAPMLAPSIPDT